MKRFFKSRAFILFIIALSLVIGIFVYAASQSGTASPLANVIGVVLTPVQKAANAVGDWFASIGGYFTNYDNLEKENVQLKERIRELEDQLIEYDTFKFENDHLKDYLGIREQHPDYDLVYATVIARDPGNWFDVFTIDKGSANGIEKRDTVITAAGLVGHISEVGSTWAKVIPIIDPQSQVGAIIPRTRDIAVLEGDMLKKESGYCHLELMPGSTSVVGDILTTSGLGDIYPRDIPIGKLVDVYPDPNGLAIYGTVQPEVNFKELSAVMVIREFDPAGGQ